MSGSVVCLPQGHVQAPYLRVQPRHWLAGYSSRRLRFGTSSGPRRRLVGTALSARRVCQDFGLGEGMLLLHQGNVEKLL